MISNPPPYCAEATLYISLRDGKERLCPDHPFYQLVEETRQGFLSSNDILEYIATSTFVENEPTPQSQLVRVGEIQNLLRYNFPVVVGTIHAAIGGGLPRDASLEVQVEKADSMEHVIYLDQFLIDGCLKKPSPLALDRRPLLTFLLKLILLREITITAWSTYGSHSHPSDKRSSTPFADPTDVFVSGCGHLYLVYNPHLVIKSDKSTVYQMLQSIMFLDEEGGYIEVPVANTPILRKLASGDWSVFQRDVITSIGPYQKTCWGRLHPLWDISCTCSKFF